MSKTVAPANTRNREPPTYWTTFSLRYFPKTEPPKTAINVATPWPATAPVVTPTGEDAAERAIVARNDLSPHSAAKTRAKVDSSSPVAAPERDTCIWAEFVNRVQ
jgi:hypothetical protein